jgi:isoamylase
VRQQIDVRAPAAARVTAWVGERAVELAGDGGTWRGEIEGQPGERYWLTVDDGQPLVDPRAADVEFVGGRPWGRLRTEWPRGAPLGRHHPDPVIYELHVKGYGGTFAGIAERLDHIVGLGVDVIELMPVHPFDTTANYWGYMPVVWGAVHRPYATDLDDAPGELCRLVAAAHDRGLEVWLDVVFNHTGEGDDSMPTWTLRGLDPLHAYRLLGDWSPANDSGCGNDINPADPYVRSLILDALDRYADLGIDGFRFDLASLLTRDGGGLVGQITEWACERDVTLVAEAWDLASYQVGHHVWPPAWLQWNDRFRDDGRAFLAGYDNTVLSVIQRVQGSPDLFPAAAWRSVNFLTAHDGLTMHDLTILDHGGHRAWNTGPELRPQQLRNYFTLLLLARGPAMFVMGDEFARTQDGDPNPFDVDGPRTWVDWDRAVEWSELIEFVRHAVNVRRSWQPAGFSFHGVGPVPDLGPTSHSLAWCSGNLYVLANAWREPLTFGIFHPGEWEVALDTAGHAGPDERGVVVPAHSMVVLRRQAA